MAKTPPPLKRTKGADAIAYRAAMIVRSLDELCQPDLPEHARNAFIQSTLIDLRALIGFLLMDAADIRIQSRADDVKPSWYLPQGQTWMPRTRRRRRALYSFYVPVGTHLAHIAIKTRTHPGQWPVVEAALVVGEDLANFFDALTAKAPKEAERFTDGSLPDILAALAQRPYARPQQVRPAEASVRRAQRLLSTQLGWPQS